MFAPLDRHNTFGYDVVGRQVYTLDAEGYQTTMVYNKVGRQIATRDGANLLLETAQSEVAFLTQATYTWQPLAYGNLISQRRIGGAWNFYHFDGLGSTDRLTNSAQTVTDTYCYSAYGELLGDSGDTVNPYLWIGRSGYFQNIEILKYYVRARYYDPIRTHWLSEDPIGVIGGICLYKYAGNSPLNYTDASGLQALPPGVPLDETLVPNAAQKKSRMTTKGTISVLTSFRRSTTARTAFSPT